MSVSFPLRRVLVLSLSLIAVIGHAAPVPRFEVVDVGVAISGQVVDANAINNRGQIVGTYGASDQYVHAFLYDNGRVQDISPTGFNSYVYDLNDAGQFISDFPGGFTGNPPLQTPLGFIGAYPAGLNNYGVIVGQAVESATGNSVPFVYGDGVFTALPPLVSGRYADAVRINNFGLIIGSAYAANGLFYAVLYQGTNISSLGTLAGDEVSAAIALNDLGHVVGISGKTNADESISDVHGFIYRNGSLKNLGSLGKVPDTVPSGINNHDQVIGWSQGPETDATGFLWVNERLYDINDLIVPRRRDFHVRYLYDINDSGWIVGTAVGPGFSGALLLKPIANGRN